MNFTTFKLFVTNLMWHKNLIENYIIRYLKNLLF